MVLRSIVSEANLDNLLNAISIPRIPFTKNIIPRLLLSDSMIFYFGRQYVKYNTAYIMPYI